MFIKKTVCFVCFLMISIIAFTQVSEIQSTANVANEPEWVQMMYQDDADPDLVEQAYERYYQICFI